MTSRFCVWMASMAVAAVSALIIPATAAAMPSCGNVPMRLSTGAVTATEYVGVFHLAVILTNTDTQTSCTLQGYPEVVLIGPDDPMYGSTYQLPRQSGDPQPLTLAPGASASSVLTYMPEGPGGWVPSTIVVTLPEPDSSIFLSTPWIPGGVSLLRQDAATHPGNYIGPLKLTD